MQKQQNSFELSKEKVPLFKFIVVGDQSVGKSCIVKRYQDDSFNQNCRATIGVEFIKKLVQIEQGLVEIQIWDTAGQEQFRSMIRSFYRGAAAVFLVYSINLKESFDQLNIWLNEIEWHAHEEIVKILVGNKCDLQREVPQAYAEAFMNKNHFSLFFETSAKTGENIENAFVQAVNLVLFRYFSSEAFRKETRVNKKSGDPIKIIQKSDTVETTPHKQNENERVEKQDTCC